MSIVCCKIDDGIIEIASDSITVRGYTQSKGKEGGVSKLLNVNGMFIGGVGTCEETSLLQIFSQTRKPKAATEDDMLIFISEFADWKNKKTTTYKLENSYMFVYGGKAFMVEGFYISEIKTFQAIGAGMDFALAALFLGESAEKAVETACELSIYCELPVVRYRINISKEKILED